MPLESRFPPRAAALACAAFLAVATPHSASASWPPFGRAISRTTGDQVAVAATGDAAGGAIIAWLDFRDATANVYTGHVLASGEIDPAWPVNGRALRGDPAAVAGEPTGPAFPAIVPDGSGGAIVAWQDSRNTGTGRGMYAQHVLASGDLDPAWSPNGTALCAIGGGQSLATAAPDGAGGAIVAWIDSRAGVTNLDIYAQHVLASGLVDSRWPVNGLAVGAATGDQEFPAVVGDGAGGVIVAWNDGRNAGTTANDIYAHHVLASGGVDPAWPVNGRALSAAAGDQLQPRIVSDGAGGGIVTWYDLRTGVGHIYAHHVLATGAADPAWPVDGRALTNRAGSEESPNLVADCSGGAIVTWQVTGNGFVEVYAHHVLGAGTLDPVWPAGGALVRHANLAANSRVTTDGAGGAVVAWQDVARIAAQHVLANGTFDPAYPDTGRTIVAQQTRQSVSSVVATGSGGAIVSWSDARNGIDLDVFAQQVLEATTAGVPVPDAPGFAFQRPGPNPARGATTLRFSLPSQAGVRLAIYDVQGRRVRELVSGPRPAGEHAVGWDFRDEHGEPVGAGTYFARLDVGGRTVTRKVVRVR